MKFTWRLSGVPFENGFLFGLSSCFLDGFRGCFLLLDLRNLSVSVRFGGSEFFIFGFDPGIPKAQLLVFFL